jgi:predicted methyltransferase
MSFVRIYNVPGQLIRLVQVDAGQIRIDNLPGGLLITKIFLQDGKCETRKVVIK